MTDKIRLVIIDADPLYRQGITYSINGATDIEVLAEGASAEDGIQLASSLMPDILLLDIDIPGEGLTVAQAVAASCPATKIVMLTAFEDELRLLPALHAGARACVLRTVSGEELIRILHSVWAGEVYVAPRLAVRFVLGMASGRPAMAAPSNGPAANLTRDLNDRERLILELVAGGMSNKEIGQRVNLKEKTVKHHMTRIMHKLQVRSRVQAALLLKRGKLL